MEHIRVVIIDDHPLFRQGLRDVLRQEPELEVIGEGASGEQALELTRRLQPDALILDMNLPGLNGLQVTQQLRAEHLPTAVIILTAYDDSSQILHAFRAGCSAYCSKEVTPRTLTHILRQVVQGHYVVGDQLFDYEGLQTWLEHGTFNALRELNAPLSQREMQILQYVTRGLSNKEIAVALGISHQTVKNHMTTILQKLGVGDRTQAAVYTLRHGWVRLLDA